MTDKTEGNVYRAPRSIVVFYAALLAFGTVLFLVFAFSSAFDRESQNKPPLWVVGVVLVALGWIWYWYLGMAYEIRIGNASNVEFHSVLRRISIPSHSIKMVKLNVFQNPHTITIVYAEGKLSLLFPIHGFYKFLAWLKETNPSAETMNL